jgi:hypothetical protein
MDRYYNRFLCDLKRNPSHQPIFNLTHPTTFNPAASSYTPGNIAKGLRAIWLTFFCCFDVAAGASQMRSPKELQLDWMTFAERWIITVIVWG